ncbi:putative MFS family arabinose efflux permease [Nocardioides albertanoniae]|uniref:Putative MFS family arabinose efflux permease n=1 Tax=Nocardioides albertanoniae TaxID=1175486 RepID=A0A543A8W5_9ACTN|nr:MFS transporter [Nocardioides albertanoniae]TQL68979.1 putative MFS family arabinose efflux permease [Nocardioides albertanoniae]
MSTTSAPPRRVGRAGISALGVLAVATGALESVVTPTLPLLQRELDMTPADGALLSIVLLITGALITPVAGKLGDRFGGRKILTRLMTVVAVGGLVSALAPSLPFLLLGQVLQGAMVGALPLSFILARKHLPAEESKVAIGVISGLFVGGGMVGTLAAGPVAEGLSRHWMFAIPTFVVIAATVAVSRLLPTDEPGQTDKTRLDWAGLLLLSGALVTLMLALSLAPEVASRPLALLGLLVLLGGLVIGWIAVERRAAAPMVDLRMLALPTMWRSCVLTFVICVGTSAAIYLVPQLLAVPTADYGFGASATEIGLLLLPGAVAAAVAGPVSGVGVRRLGPRAVVTIGIVLLVTGLIGVAMVHTEVWHIVVAKTLIAFASGLCVTALVTNVATSVAESDTGIASSLVLVTRVVGYAVGAQISGALLTVSTPSGSSVPAESAFVTGFVLAGIVSALAIIVTRTMKKEVTS